MRYMCTGRKAKNEPSATSRESADHRYRLNRPRRLVGAPTEEDQESYRRILVTEGIRRQRLELAI